MAHRVRSLRPAAVPAPAAAGQVPLEDLLTSVARGDQDAFTGVYERLGPAVLGLIRRVLRDPAQSEAVAQEVFVEVWRTASRYDRDRGSVSAWVTTMAHRRAVDRVRSMQSATEREARIGRFDADIRYDEVTEQVPERLEQEQVRHCLSSLTELQRESVTLAYYGGYSYREVSELLDVPPATVKTRLRDGLIRLRDGLGVAR